MTDFSSPRLAARLTTGLVAGLVLLLAGCASPRHKAPVEDRAQMSRPAGAAPAASAAEGTPAKAEPGTYIVKPGDTLMRISLDVGQSWRDLARWNNLENPNVIEVGQVLRVVAPGSEAAASSRPVASPKADTRPLDGSKPAAASGAVAGASAAASGSAPAASTVAAPAPAAPKDADDDIQWAWPSSGAVLNSFDEVKTKGLAFSGKAGDPVYAAADGRVIYANSGVRGYGNLIIVKHNANYLTAYAHNQSLLVKEDQVVRKGQKIAEMGSSDAERVQLHFEVRRQGKPIDPAKVLPAR